jgi:hypothetical protein
LLQQIAVHGPGKLELTMNRTSGKQKKAKPRPGAAKLNATIDTKMGEKADELSLALVNGAIKGNPTCLQIIVNVAKNAEFAQDCLKVYSESIIDQWEKEAREQMALEATEEGAETTAGPREPES